MLAIGSVDWQIAGLDAESRYTVLLATPRWDLDSDQAIAPSLAWLPMTTISFSPETWAAAAIR